MPYTRDMTIIFDFDGTIADSFPFVFEFLRTQAKVADMGPEWQKQYHYLSMAVMARRLGINWWRLPMLFFRGRQHMSDDLHSILPFAGMPELITSLDKAGHRLLILSSNRPPTIAAFLKRYELDKCFLEIYGQIGLFGKAPVLRRIMKKHNLVLEDCIYIGDELRDVEAAESVRMRVIAVKWGFANPDHLADLKPYALVNTPHELTELLQKVVTESKKNKTLAV